MSGYCTEGGRKERNNYLDRVICKIDFVEPEEYGTGSLRKFYIPLKDKFPYIDERQKFEVKISTSTMQQESNNPASPMVKTWQMSNKEKTQSISLENDNVLIEFKEYSTYDEFFNIIEIVTKSLFETHPDIIIKRLGIRYINNFKFDGNPYDLRRYFNDNLIPPTDFLSDAPKISRIINMVEYQYEDYRIRYQYGIPNSQYPGKIKHNEFLIDIDVYTDVSLDNQKDICDKVNMFHEKVLEFVRLSLEQEFKEKVGVPDD